MMEAARSLFSIKVPIEQLMVPIDSCLRVTAGPIPTDIVGRMENLDFDFAIMEEEIWDGNSLAMLKTLGLISRARLDQLQRANSPLRATEPVILKTSLNANNNGEVSINMLLYGMSNATHALVFEDVSEHYWQEGYCERAWGLITISDLNKPPLRAIVYMLLARLETCIGRIVRDGYADPMEWVDRIEDNQQRQRIIEYWRQSELDRVNVGPEAGATLTELLRAAGAKSELCMQLGYDSRSQLKKATAPVVDLRNQIMHPVRPLITTPAGCTRLRETLELVLKICKKVEDSRAV